MLSLRNYLYRKYVKSFIGDATHIVFLVLIIFFLYMFLNALFTYFFTGSDASIMKSPRVANINPQQNQRKNRKKKKYCKNKFKKSNYRFILSFFFIFTIFIFCTFFIFFISYFYFIFLSSLYFFHFAFLASVTWWEEILHKFLVR